MNVPARAVVSGTLAAIAASAALAVCARREGHAATQPLNATSHWLHGDEAAEVPDADARHTGVGFATHHAASIMWAGMFEALRERDTNPSAAGIVRDAALTSLTAAVVDYTVTPHRFTPGWELVLSKRSMAISYLAMTAGFIAAEYLLPRRGREL